MPEPIKLYEHQKKAAAIIAARPRFGLFFEPGAGKTHSMLSGIMWSNKDLFIRTVVVCPLAVAVTAWANDVQHYPLRFGQCAGEPPAVRKRVIASDADIIAVNFEVFEKCADDLLAAGFLRLVVDESSALKNHESKRTRAILRYAEKCKAAYMLSGTPAPNGEFEYFAQLRILRPDAVSPSFYSFAYQYFDPIKQRVPMKVSVVGSTEKRVEMKEVVRDWTLKDSRRESFTELLKSCSWALRKQDCLDLPEQTDVVRMVKLSGPEQDAYDSAVENMRVWSRNGEIKLNPSNLVNKLRQMCGGWCYANADRDLSLAGRGEPIQFGSAKLNALDDLLDELGDNQVVIWVDFRTDAARVAALLAERMARPSASRIKGGGSFHELHGASNTDRAQAVADFQAGNTTYLVCHPASVGHGVTMTAASHAVYYSIPWSFELFQQSRDRIHRVGQTKPCTYHHLLSSGTVDARVLKAVREKKTNHETMMEILSEIVEGPLVLKG